jgi:uncharacterized repeat protein (TIGR01451 family)
LTNLAYFNFTYVSTDHPTTFAFQVYSDATHGSVATIAFPNPGGGILTNHQILPGAFGAISGLSAADFSSIKRIVLLFDQYLEIDTAVREIQAITSENPGLACTKSFSTGSVIGAGAEITATVVITNTGDVPLHVDVQDVLDAGLAYKETVAGFPVPVSTPPTLTWTNLGPLAPGASVTLQYVITVVAISDGQQLCNDVTATAVEYPEVVTNCYACVTKTPKIPTFTQWGVVGLLLILAASGAWFMRRRRSLS